MPQSDEELEVQVVGAAALGEFGADLAWRHGFRGLAVLVSDDEEGTVFANALTDSFNGFGGRVLSVERFVDGETDLEEPLQILKKHLLGWQGTGPNGLYIITRNQGSAIAALRDARAVGIEEQLFGSPVYMRSDVHQAAGEAAQHLYIVDTDLKIYKVKSGSLDLRDN